MTTGIDHVFARCRKTLSFDIPVECCHLKSRHIYSKRDESFFHDKPSFDTLFSYNDCSDFRLSACRLCPLCKTVVNIKRVAMKHICVSSNGSKVIVVTQVRILRTIKGMDWKRGPKRQCC